MNHESVPRRSSGDTEGDVARVLGKLEHNGSDLTILRVLANSQPIFRPFVKLSSAMMFDASFPEDVREAVILWLARYVRNTYEWAEHVPMSQRAGVSDEAREGLRIGDTSALTDEQRIAVELTEELKTTGTLSAASWATAVERWNVDGTLEFVAIVGWWGGMVPTVLGALGLDVPDDQRGTAPVPQFD